MSAAIFDELTSAVSAQGSLDRRVEVLLQGLAERMAMTSNDQNVQKLSRELRAAAPALAAAVLAS